MSNISASNLSFFAMLGTILEETIDKEAEEFERRAKAALSSFKIHCKSEKEIRSVGWKRTRFENGKLIDKNNKILAEGEKEICGLYNIYCGNIAQLSVLVGRHEKSTNEIERSLLYDGICRLSLDIEKISREYFNFADGFVIVKFAKDTVRLLKEEVAKTSEQVAAEEKALEKKAEGLLDEAEKMLGKGSHFADADVQSLVQRASSIAQDLGSEKALARVRAIGEKALSCGY